jgi:hypothetical protein
MNIVETVNSKNGNILISALLGLGLAALFRSACKDKNCLIIKGPTTEETDKYFYKIQDQCFKYTPVVSECSM